MSLYNEVKDSIEPSVSRIKDDLLWVAEQPKDSVLDMVKIHLFMSKIYKKEERKLSTGLINNNKLRSPKDEINNMIYSSSLLSNEIIYWSIFERVFKLTDEYLQSYLIEWWNVELYKWFDEGEFKHLYSLFCPSENDIEVLENGIGEEIEDDEEVNVEVSEDDEEVKTEVKTNKKIQEEREEKKYEVKWIRLSWSDGISNYVKKTDNDLRLMNKKELQNLLDNFIKDDEAKSYIFFLKKKFTKWKKYVLEVALSQYNKEEYNKENLIRESNLLKGKA